MGKRKIHALLLSIGTLCLCACGQKTDTPEVSIDPEEFKSGEKLITFADLTPNPTLEEDVDEYRDLGLNTFLMTEDYVPFAKEEKLNPAYLEACRKVGEQGLDVWIRNYYNDEDYFQNSETKQGSNYGTPYSLSPRDVTTEFQAVDCIKGFYMADEPYMTTPEDKPLYAAMDRYGKLVNWKNQYYPDAFWHMNHVPSSSYDHFPGHTYEEFLQYYADNILTPLNACPRDLSIDRYPLSAEDQLDQGYLSDLLVAATVNKRYNDSVEDGKKSKLSICLQTFMNTNPMAHLIDITSPEEVSFQIYTAFAMGAKVLEYFCYRSLSAFDMYGIVDDDGNKRIYDMVKKANDRSLWMSDAILGFDWRGVSLSRASSEGMRQNEASFAACEKYTISDADRGVLKGVNSRLDTVVGCFQKGKQDGYMVVNYTHPLLEQTDIVTLDFSGCQKAVVYQNNEAKVVDLLDGKLRLNLSQGDGAFVIPR